MTVRTKQEATGSKEFNSSQKEAWKLLQELPIVCLIGPPGCGKTYVAAEYAAHLVKKNKAENIVYMRMPVEMGRSRLGYLQGSLNEKMAPYAEPIFAICKKTGISPHSLKIAAPGYVQGVTFDDAVVIVDECQVFDVEEFKAVVTRLGKNSKLIFCGDPTQDTRRMGQLPFILSVLSKLPSVGIQYFNYNDNMRHPVIVEVATAFEDAIKKESCQNQ
jgi:phosphate starvation-inducible protein PhoH